MLGRRLPRQYRGRESTLAPWSELAVDPAIVRRVLGIVADAFGWNESDGLRLRPNDKLWPIYHSYYPQTHWWQRCKPDELEMETLLRDVRSAAPPGTAIDLHQDIALADLVRCVAGSETEL
jgi:hypothetical protein